MWTIISGPSPSTWREIVPSRSRRPRAPRARSPLPAQRPTNRVSRSSGATPNRYPVCLRPRAPSRHVADGFCDADARPVKTSHRPGGFYLLHPLASAHRRTALGFDERDSVSCDSFPPFAERIRCHHSSVQTTRDGEREYGDCEDQERYDHFDQGVARSSPSCLHILSVLKRAACA
jgi:hypothetical protein